MASVEDPTKASPLPKACENCRIRKIRCNRESPCSNCLSSGIDCRPSIKQVEHRPRMIVSNHYEKQIERIHERLFGIEAALKSISTSHSPPSPQPQASHTSTQRASTGTPSQYEGDSSFLNQSVRATEAVRSLNIKNDGDLSIAIDSLKEVINAKDVSIGPTNDGHFTPAAQRPSHPQMELLPPGFVIKVLAKIKDKLPVCFYNFSLPNDGHLERLCQRAYFPTESMSLGEITSMYGLLLFVLQEYIMFADEFASEIDCQKHLETCTKNFYAGIETYDLLAIPSFDNVFALMLAAFQAQDEGNISSCWSLSSVAARHLQALGYHRESALKNDAEMLAEKKRHLFWTVYSIEKNVSLNLGRASSFQDWDIDVKMFKISSDPKVAPWNIGTIIFVDLSRLQGQIYEKLYSASALSKSQAERGNSIEELVHGLDVVYNDFLKVDRSNAAYGEFYQMFYQACDVIYYSLLTLIHRASSGFLNGTEISAKCFEAAKQCLKRHLHYFPLFTAQGDVVTSGYVNWVLLYCSFTPFIVVFLHAIASTSHEDVKLLHDMTASLEPVKSLSSVLHRLCEVCRVFSRVAEVIVQNQSQPQPPGINTALGSYDEQTDSLYFPGFAGHPGFDPTHQLPDIFMQGSATDPTAPNMDDMSAYFGNWVNSNQPSMDLFSLDFGNTL